VAWEDLGNQFRGINQNTIRGEDQPHPVSKEDADAFMNALTLLPQFALMRMPSLFGKANRAMSAVDRLADAASASASRMPQSPNAGVPRTDSRLTPRVSDTVGERVTPSSPRFTIPSRDTLTDNNWERAGADAYDPTNLAARSEMYHTPDLSKIDTATGYYSAPVFRSAGLSRFNPQPPQRRPEQGVYNNSESMPPIDINDPRFQDAQAWHQDINDRAYQMSDSLQDTDAHQELALKASDAVYDYLGHSQTTNLYNQRLQSLRDEVERITGFPMKYLDEDSMETVAISMTPDQLNTFFQWLGSL
jgi:hypothetical protein